MKKIPILKTIFIGVVSFVASKIKIILLLIFILALSWFVFDYIEAKKQIAFLSDPETQQQARIEVEQKEIEKIVMLVSKLIILPAGAPNLATIQDAETLSVQQPFFKDAENGDKILIYKDKAIIFSPTKNMLVNVGPVYSKDTQTTPVTSSKEVGVDEDIK